MMSFGKSEQRSGFTLVELMLAVVLVSILASAIGSLLVFENRALIRNTRMLELQRDASLAMNVIANGIHSAKIGVGDVSFVNGTTLYFEDNLTEGVQWDQAKGELISLPSKMVLVRSDWNIVNFSSERHNNGTWRVVLQLVDPETLYQQVLVSSYSPKAE